MKLVQKLSLAFLVGVSVIVAGNGYLRVRREVALFESDRTRDHRLLGKTLAAATSAAWRAEGQPSALMMIDKANALAGKIRIRWTWLAGTANPRLSSADRSALEGLPEGESITRVATDEHGVATRYTYVRVSTPTPQKGALELSESLSSEQSYIEKTVTETVATAVVLVLFCAGLATVLSVWLVGRPIDALVEKARRVGRGDFSEPVQVPSRDEFAVLAREMNAMSERLVETIHQLRHADRLTTVGKLASGVAHELGTPLNVIAARAEMIVSGEAMGDEAVEYARVIVESSDRVTLIVRQLLEFARQQGPEKAPRDLRELAGHVIDLLQPLSAKRSVEIALHAGGPAVSANVDAGQIEQVLTNLVMNAVQATRGPGKVLVTVSSVNASPPADHGGPQGHHALISVADHGVGMTPEQLERIFEPFYTTKEVGEGTGLGLAVAYGIVRDHRGWIAVRSAVDHGSEFSVYLPEKCTV